MSKQTHYYAVAAVFLIVGLLHLVRAINQWDLIVGDIAMPMWVSWAVVVAAGYLGVTSFKFGRKM